MNYVYYGSINIPIGYYIMAAVIGIAAGACCFYRKMAGGRIAAVSFLSAYLFLILSSTVFARAAKAWYEYNLLLFWSYLEIYKGRSDLLVENIANTFMLFPLGLLLPVVKKMECRKVVFIGFFLSLSIELSQLVLKRGLFEFDDIVHNTLGCAIGYGVYRCRKRGA